MSLDSIVKVAITRGTRAVTRKGFGIALFLSDSTTQTELVKTYSDPDAVILAEGAGSAAAKAATSYFSQSPRPETLKIGKRAAKVAQVITYSVIDNADGTYSVVINGVSFDFIAASSSITAIRDGLVSVINAGAEPVTAAPVATDDFTLTADVSGNGFSHSTVSPATGFSFVVTAANFGVVEDFAFMEDEDADWYGVALESRNLDDIKNAATYIETKGKIFGAVTEDADVKTSVTTDIASFLQAKAYLRTWYFWADNQDLYPEMAWFGRTLTKDPGTQTWMFKDLAGITVDKFTTDELTNLTNKNVNYYVLESGQNIMQPGKMVNGEFIDVVRLIDFLKSRIQEAIFACLVNLDKIALNNSGGAILETDIRGVLQNKVGSGLTSFTVTIPDESELTTAQKLARTFAGIKFNAQLDGATHIAEIDGVVTV